MESINIRTDKSATIQYRKVGQGPALVLIHGFPEDGSIWEYVIPPLAANNTVLIPDTPGSGGSELVTDMDSIDQLASGIEAMLTHEGLDEVIIAGHSMGGYIAMAFAESHRAWLKGVSLIHSVASGDSEEKKETRRKSIELIRKGGKEPFVKQMVPNMFSAKYKDEHPEMMTRQVERGMQLEAGTMTLYYEAMMNRKDRRDVLNDIRVPVQWIIGKEDNLIPEKLVLSQCRAADVNFVSVYNDCGHMSMLEQPEKLTADLKLFTSYCYNR